MKGLSSYNSGNLKNKTESKNAKKQKQNKGNEKTARKIEACNKKQLGSVSLD